MEAPRHLVRGRARARARAHRGLSCSCEVIGVAQGSRGAPLARSHRWESTAREVRRCSGGMCSRPRMSCLASLLRPGVRRG
eukprot:scaffold84933_cov55-Phaeocystis_antarctica.AAC.1